MSDERWQLISVTAAAITVPGDLPVAVILSVAVALAVSPAPRKALSAPAEAPALKASLTIRHPGGTAPAPPNAAISVSAARSAPGNRATSRSGSGDHGPGRLVPRQYTQPCPAPGRRTTHTAATGNSPAAVSASRTAARIAWVQDPARPL